MLVNGYDIKSEIHRGPVTTVYDAIHIELGRRVLLKVLNKQWMADHDLIERFRREAKICARLDHPNIVKIFHFSITPESVFISMEYIEGSSLERYLQKNKLSGFSEILSLTYQILSGLAYAHDLGVVHRDMKPSNIMISDDNRAKITDFGLAVVSDLPGITGQDQAVGTPAYMSPEQALGKELDQRTDLFSLGVSIYKICTQKSPFEADNIGTTIQNILTKDVPGISNYKPEIPLWFSELIDSLLAKNRDDRPKSAQAVLDIIGSNSKNEEYKQAKFIFDHGQMNSRQKSWLKKLNSKMHTRIFIWAFPLLTIIAYLIFMQQEVESGEEPVVQNQPSQIREIAIPDSAGMAITVNSKQTDTNLGNPGARLADEVPVSNTSRIIKSDTLTGINDPAPQLQNSRLFVIAKPWADVYIDSVYHDATPFTQSIALAPGAHIVELRNPNYQTFSEHVYLHPADTDTLFADLKLNVGFLSIRVLPWAKIYINGEYRETSPIEKPITLATGEHIITLTNPGYTSISDTIEILSGKTIDKNLNFSK